MPLSINHSFLVTTRIEILNGISFGFPQVVMLDGTVPGFFAAKDDIHYDHHRPGGAEIQILELPRRRLRIMDKALFCTTQVDADAICAAVYCLLSDIPNFFDGEYFDVIQKLTAISYDCDHLCVPPHLSHLADFAAQAVAALKTNGDEVAKQLKLPTNRREWDTNQKEAFSSQCFRLGVERVYEACLGERSWPGEKGEAKAYWQKVEDHTKMIRTEARIGDYRGCLLFDAKGLGGTYIDPRCWLRAAGLAGFKPKYPVTLTQREVFVDNQFKGYSYTLGCIPLREDLVHLDYTQGAFESLTYAERQNNPNADGWGGRKTVGGSGWNTPSTLSPTEVIDIVVATLY